MDASFFGVSVSWITTFVIKGLVIYLFVRIVTAIVKFLFRRAQRRQRKIVLDETKIGFLRQIVITAIYIIGVSAFLSLIPGMEKVSNSILASAGILAMAVGLASQEALSNVIGGLFIIFSRPFKVGDFIKVDDIVTGTIVEITLRHTVIRNIENRMILIPNSKINSSTVINSNFGDTHTCSLVDEGVAYNTDLDRAMALIQEVAMDHPLLIDKRSPEDKKNNVPQVLVRVIELGSSAITLRAWAWADGNANAFVLKCDLLKAIKERFDREGIEIPYPYSNHIIRQA